jgi:hypothetical protein
MALPIPRLAPVITTVLFLNGIANIFSNLIKKPLHNRFVSFHFNFIRLILPALNKKLIKHLFDFN